MDPERLVQCPYDKNHQIRACRLPYHLVKCRKNNQKIARELATCPYNARHRVPKQELKLHIASCENKVSPEVLEVTSSRGDPKNRIKEVTAWQCPPPEEDWEAATLVRGARNSHLPFLNCSPIFYQLWKMLLQRFGDHPKLLWQATSDKKILKMSLQDHHRDSPGATENIPF
ncbi:gametocyte-specific factor 1-like isoform X1 [Lacerta agilis]|uniref:gametocyte-specific factor 1-like isoform X1 n=1 Tax=Lacerta agilis TaxID=80427 RepID=UPI00141930A2|nr:gametocyte-specific factor 1-like isoform X1 [Lacerta agilis]